MFTNKFVSGLMLSFLFISKPPEISVLEKTENKFQIQTKRGVSQTREKMDTSICSLITLGDDKGILNNLGDLKQFTINNDSLPYVNVINETKDELLRIFIYPGSGYNQPDYFEIKYLDKNSSLPTNYLVLKNCVSFETENNIHLGLTEEMVRSILGNEFEVIKNGNNKIIKYPGVDLYQEVFEFENGYLIKFGFGDIYP